MKCKRIVALFDNKIEVAKKDRQINRIFRSLDIAEDNAMDAIDSIELKKSKLLEILPEASDLDSAIRKLSDYIGEQEEQQEVIKRIKKVKEYLNEEIEVEEKGE